MTHQTVYQAVNAITAALARTGIPKSGRNQQQGYAFRGIDQVYGHLAGLLAEHGLVVYPQVLERETTERQTQRGTPLYHVSMLVKYSFVLSSDPTSGFEVVVASEAMDSADKAVNKAMSAAYKYCALQTFAIPVEGEPDADQDHHEPAASQGPSRTTQSAQDAPAQSTGAVDRAKRAATMLARFQSAIQTNSPERFLEDQEKLTAQQWSWVYSQLDADQGEWAAKVMQGAGR